MNGFFDKGTANVGGKDVIFEKRSIPGNYLIYVPKSFCEDDNIVSNYSYLFSEDKSPLSIAVKYTSVEKPEDHESMIEEYFARSPESRQSVTETLDENIFYRETVTSSRYISVYSLRFSVQTGGGILFGCFNCSAKYKDDWKPVVLQILQNIEQV